MQIAVLGIGLGKNNCSVLAAELPGCVMAADSGDVGSLFRRDVGR